MRLARNPSQRSASRLNERLILLVLNDGPADSVQGNYFN